MLREEPALLSLCLAFTVQDGRSLSVPGPMADSVGRLGLAYLVRFSSLASLCPTVQQQVYHMTHFASAATVGQRCERIVSCNADAILQRLPQHQDIDSIKTYYQLRSPLLGQC